MRAVFAGVQNGDRPLKKESDPARVKELRRQLTALEEEIIAAEPIADPRAKEPRRVAVNALGNVEKFAPVKAKFIRFTIEATNNLEPCIDELEIFAIGKNVALGARPTSSGDYPGAAIHKLQHINDGKYGNSRSWISNTPGKGWVQLELSKEETIDRIAWARDREGKFADRLATKYRIEVALEPGQWQIIASSADRAAFGVRLPDLMQERLIAKRAGLEKQLRAAEGTTLAYLGKFTAPEPTHRLHRGDPMQKREEIAPGALTEFGVRLKLQMNATDAERRLALARWIADPKNPLTARVLVNRLWHHHFGQGIVSTPSDFGLNGGKPSHPELIDWLASEFMKPTSPTRKLGDQDDPRLAPGAGWSMKHIHRLILTSATYRQASAFHAQAAAVDKDARLLWRYPPRRLDAEPLRDAYLFVSGKLDLTMYGPGFDLFEPNNNYVKVYNPKKDFGLAEFRRMIYQSKWRMQVDDVFGHFDCPDAGQIAPKRTTSTTALQALALLNSRFMLQQAKFFAERIEKEVGKDVDKQVTHGFRLAFQRDPSATESTAAGRLVREHGLTAFCRALFNANEFLFVD
jgi:hypothetical protein